MGKAYYTEYVNHCMRFYANYKKPKFRSEVEKENWKACERALRFFPPEEVDLLLEVYRGGDTMADNIYRVSVVYDVRQDTLWRMTAELGKKIAKIRKLI